MSERFYRLLIGISTLLLLFFNQEAYISILIGLLVLEGITNIRIPSVLSRIRNRESYILPPLESGQYRINFESERMGRFVISTVLTCSVFIFYEQAWFLSWFLGTMLTITSISNFCPMLIFLRWVGFK